MISQWSPDGRETRYDPRQMVRWPEMDTDQLECWHGPIEVYEGGSLKIREGRGCVFLPPNEAQWCNAWREEVRVAKNIAEVTAFHARQLADRCDEVRGVRE